MYTRRYIVRPIENTSLVGKRRRRELFALDIVRKDQVLILRSIESSPSHSGDADILLQKFLCLQYLELTCRIRYVLYIHI